MVNFLLFLFWHCRLQGASAVWATPSRTNKDRNNMLFQFLVYKLLECQKSAIFGPDLKQDFPQPGNMNRHTHTETTKADCAQIRTPLIALCFPYLTTVFETKIEFAWILIRRLKVCAVLRVKFFTTQCMITTATSRERHTKRLASRLARKLPHWDCSLEPTWTQILWCNTTQKNFPQLKGRTLSPYSSREDYETSFSFDKDNQNIFQPSRANSCVLCRIRTVKWDQLCCLAPRALPGDQSPSSSVSGTR